MKKMSLISTRADLPLRAPLAAAAPEGTSRRRLPEAGLPS